MPETTIIDTSSLIALERINLLEMLCRIYKDVIVPESVVKEFGNLALPCVSIRKVDLSLSKLLTTDLNLGKGEADAMALASHLGLNVVIDDLKARKVAENMGLKITGTIGVLVKAEKVGLITSAYEKMKELRDKGFYVAEELLLDLSRIKNKT